MPAKQRPEAAKAHPKAAAKRKTPLRPRSTKPKAKAKPKSATKPKATSAKKAAHGGARKGAGRKAGDDGYAPRMAHEAKELTLRRFSQNEVAEAMDVSVRTLRRWRMKYPDFDAGFEITDEDYDRRIKRSVAERATGYTIRAKRVFHHQGKVIEYELDEHVPGDLGAAKFWLTNRDPENWSDRREMRVDAAGAFAEMLASISGATASLI